MPIAKKELTAGAVRKIVGQARGMTDTGFIRIFQRKRLKSCRGRREVYNRFRALRAQVAKMLALSWTMPAVEMARDGLKRRYGKAPTANAARAWQRICRGCRWSVLWVR